MIALALLDIVALALAAFASILWYRERLARIELAERVSTMETQTVIQVRKIADAAIAEARRFKEERDTLEAAKVAMELTFQAQIAELSRRVDVLQTASRRY